MPVDAKRVQSLFSRAVEAKNSMARAALLERECQDDLALRQRVEALLRAHDDPEGVLESGAGQPVLTGAYTPVPEEKTKTSAPAESPGTRIGPYKLLQPIGEGGMGIVWMAEQQEPVRRLVALKVIRAGMDSAQVVARFEAERQALALMDHPNIAKVLDAGTVGEPREEGRGTSAVGGSRPAPLISRPYFVMELVKGTPITKYCDEQRLTPAQRLELFIPVCHALQHAHQKGIIHRDIKPSNVLVAPYDGKPVVKVIDFGVAKATGQRLTEKTMFTEFGAVIGTLEYMSPEQAELNNQDIDTRSDIYSLGVLLYELLTGTTPLDKASLQKSAFMEVLRTIREVEPPKPSMRLSTSGKGLPNISAQRQMEPAKLTKLVRGELDWIVMKALEKDRARRYETANGLARDIERFLKEEPVEACPPSAGYRLRKLLQRNKGMVAATALIIFALLAGIAGTSWGLVRAERALQDEAKQRGLAERERDEKEQARAVAARERDEKEQARLVADKHRKEAASARDQAEKSVRYLYFNSIILAHQYWQGNNLLQSRRILDSCPSATRGWEWRYLDRLHHADQLTLKGNYQDKDLSFSKDGKRMAAFSSAGARIWDLAAQKPLAEVYFQPNREFSCATLSPDGNTIAMGEKSGLIGFWDATSGRFLRQFARVKSSVDRLSFSPDGKWLVMGRADRRNGEMLLPLLEAPRYEDLVVWEIASGKEIFHPKGYGFVAQFSPDGSRLLTFKRNTALRLAPMIPEVFPALFDTADWKEVAAGKLGTGTSFSFSGDGKRLALGGRDRMAETVFVSLVDPADGAELSRIAPKAVGDIALDHDGSTLAFTEGLGSWQIEIWDMKRNRRLQSLRGHTNNIFGITFAPDGRLASCSWDNTIKFWDARANQEVRNLAPGSVGLAGPALFSPGATSLAFAQPNTTSLFTGTVQKATVIDATSGSVLHTLAGHQRGTIALAFNRDGKRLATGGRSGETTIWNTETGAPMGTFRHDGEIAGLALSPDGRWAASTHEQKELTQARWKGEYGKTKEIPISVKVWDTATGQERWSLLGHPAGVRSLAFSPDGRLIASAGFPTVKVWDLASGKPVREFEQKEAFFSTSSLLFSPDGNLLAAAGSGLGQQPMIRLWDVRTSKLFQLLQGHQMITDLRMAFSPDQKRLATAAGREVKIWDVASGQEALTLPVPDSGFVIALEWTADGQRLRAALRDASVVEWDGTPRK